MKQLLLLGLAATMIFAGCSEDSDSDDNTGTAGSEPATGSVDALFSSLFTQLCEHQQGCCTTFWTENADSATDADSCEASKTPLITEMQRRIDAGTLAFDAAKFDACVQAIPAFVEGAECKSQRPVVWGEFFNAIAGCEGILTSSLMAGDTCEISVRNGAIINQDASDCGSGLLCYGAEGEEASCAMGLTEGAACGDSASSFCAPAFNCLPDGSGGSSCQALKQGGEACSEKSECESEVCTRDSDDDSAPGTCEAWDDLDWLCANPVWSVSE